MGEKFDPNKHDALFQVLGNELKIEYIHVPIAEYPIIMWQSCQSVLKLPNDTKMTQIYNFTLKKVSQTLLPQFPKRYIFLNLPSLANFYPIRGLSQYYH